jgi:hypothetical protein
LLSFILLGQLDVSPSISLDKCVNSFIMDTDRYFC